MKGKIADKKIITDLNYSVFKVDMSKKEALSLLRAAKRGAFFAFLRRQKTEQKAWLVQAAQCLQLMDKYEQSEAYCRKALKLRHDDPLALLALAEVLRTCYYEREEESLNFCTTVINENPQYAPAYYFRGLCFYEIQCFDEAVEDFTECIRLKPDWAPPYCARGTAYTEIVKDPCCEYDEDEADDILEMGFADFEKALEILPGYSLVYFNRAGTYDEYDDYENACSDYVSAIRCSEDYAEAHFSLACIYRRERKNIAAIDSFTKAIKFKKNYNAAYYNRGNSYDDLGDMKSALKDYNHIIGGIFHKKNDWAARAYVNRGNIYGRMGSLYFALQDYEAAIKLSPSIPESYNSRGVINDALGYHAKAINDFTEALAINPNYANAYFNRANVYETLKQYGKALNDYNNAIQFKANDPDFYSNRANVYRKTGDFASAQADCYAALRLDPNHAPAIEILRAL